MPTENDDEIIIAPGSEVFGLGGDDEFTWPGGNATIHGGDTGENYETNPYVSIDGGDRLILEGSNGVVVTFTTSEAGTVKLGTEALTFTGIERLAGTEGNDIIRGAGVVSGRHNLTIEGRGGDDRISGAWAFVGDISEARVYTKAMSDADLRATWQAMGGAG